ncbi:MAG: TonB-dependent receptor [Deltaproteobacteria bacterium]|nr:TonB-dependent receptor [Deltaproteobacteria bacterium]
MKRGRRSGLSSAAACTTFACLVLASGVPARGQEEPASGDLGSTAPAAAPRTPIRLEEIVVTASPLPEEPTPPAGSRSADDTGATTGPAAAAPSGAGIGVRTLSREELEAQGVRSVGEALGRHPAVDRATNSRGDHVVTLRGFEQRETVVLLDGVPTYVPYDGQLDLDLLPAGLVDHVTVVAGPGSVLWGPNGLGGAINVVTRPPGEAPVVETTFEASGRGHGARLEAVHAMRAGPVGWVLAGGVDDQRAFPLSGGFVPARNEDGGDRHNSDRSLRRLLGGVELECGPDHRLRLSGFVLDAQRGVPPSTVAADARVRWWRMNAWRVAGASVGHSGRYGERLELDELAWVRLYDNLFDGYDDARYATQELPRSFHTWYHDRAFGGRARLTYAFSEGDWASVLRVWSGVQHDRHREDEGAEVSRTLLTLAPQYEQTFDRRWRLTAGLQLDVEFPGDAPDIALDPTVGWGPLLGLRYEPLDGLSLELVAARRSRFPSLKERFSYALDQRDPNPTLGPETAWHLGLELAWRPWTWLELRAAGYDAEVAGLIAPVHLDSMVDQLQNIDAARLAGTELQVSLAPLEWLRFDLSYRYLFARRLGVDPSQEALPYRPEHTASLGASAAPWPWLGVSTFVRLVGPQRFEDPETLRWATLGTYVAWDARVDLRPLPWLDVSTRVTNLLDADYQTEYGFPSPGWQLWLGLRVTCAAFGGTAGAGEAPRG